LYLYINKPSHLIQYLVNYAKQVSHIKELYEISNPTTMKKDKLNIDSFTNMEGKNYRRSEMLEKEEIGTYFSKKGYEVIELQQIWRHVHGKLKKDNKIFFLKMASTPDIGERTQNETLWNNQIGSLIEKTGVDYFDVPHIYETGEYEGKFYYLSTHHDGAMLASKNPPSVGNLEEWIDKIIKSNLFFLSLQRQDLNFRRDQDSISSQDKWDEFFQRVQSWYEEVKEHQLQEIFDEVKNLRSTFEPGVNHGDFVPWHMIQEGEKFILIDGEHASIQSPRYYDVCYFYHRLYTSAQNPDLAKIYLGKFRNQLSEEEKNKFDLSIRPILATRIIGGFWDAKTDGQEDVAFHNKLREDFLKNNLF